MIYTVQQIADLLDAQLVGDPAVEIKAIASIEAAKQGDICFVNSPKYIQQLKETSASAVILKHDLVEISPVASIIVDNPRASYAKLLSVFYPACKYQPGIHASAIVATDATVDPSATIAAKAVIQSGAVIGENTVISEGCVIGKNSIIGRDTQLYANVTVYHDCVIGDECIIHSSTVIGADGFGFEHDKGEWLKIPQVGRAVIGNKVEIGACSVVDRGALNDTVVADGVKLDNHVQIAHNVVVGENTIMSRGVGIAGSTKIGKNCIFGGMTGVKDHIEIADNVIVTAMSLVSKSLTVAGSYSSNTPIDDTRTWRKNSARFRQLDELARRIRQLEKKIEDKS